MSWLTIWDFFYPEDMDEPHDDAEAAEMQRLKGLVIGQAAEVEAALTQIGRRLAPPASTGYRTLGQLARDIRQLLGPEGAKSWANELRVIGRAVKSRNRAAHRPVRIGSSWRPYATGGGEWVAVISMMGSDLCDEHDLRQDLALQQEATEAAVRILHSTYPDPVGSCLNATQPKLILCWHVCRAVLRMAGMFRPYDAEC